MAIKLVKVFLIKILSVTVRCGQQSNENCTYFESSSSSASGACSIKICKCNSNICQVFEKSIFKIKIPKKNLLF